MQLGRVIATLALGVVVGPAPSSEASPTCAAAQSVVERFHQAYARLDVPAMMSFYADDAVLIDPVLAMRLTSKAQIVEAAKGFASFNSVESFEVHHYCEGDRVLGTGVAQLHYRNHPVTVPFAMLFTVRGDQIVEELDYVAYRELLRVDAALQTGGDQ
jgi:ketosteroid isomerase-like protein